ncbi:MAG: TonB-dependent receptor [Chitinophagaceae bacterium]|nr:TonB-dependent receptor [Rubrivivax sp.]
MTVALVLGSPMSPARAQPAAQAVVITATRIETRAFDVPASIDRIAGNELRDGRAQVNISESLGAVPGLLARDRQNYAQDVQISVRGFGARSTFGIRGVRLYVDGIPATGPDGQGQISNVELGSVERIEILRGPFSALYGNSSGGVIQVFSEEGTGAPRVGLTTTGGSDGAVRLGLQASGASGSFGYALGASRFSTDGYREHSATTRRLGNVKLTFTPADGSKLTFVANSVALPQAEDPLGLTRAQFEADPRGVDPSANRFNTRKTVTQNQAGLVYEQRLGVAHGLQLTAYGGHRNTEQFQSIPVATQAAALQPGGVILLSRDYRGVDLRWSFVASLRDSPFTLVAGLAHDRLDERRQGFQSFSGSGTSQVLGVRGALRRDENNEVTSTDPYVQATWQAAPRWTVNAGVRRSQVRFKSTDAYVVGANPDDSGSASYSATLPVAGLMFAASEQLRLYATAGRGFETPTLNELAYRSGGGTGLNFGLRSAASRSLEIGAKGRITEAVAWTAALFQTDTDHEIVTQTNSGGRSTFQNAGATERRGLELSWSQRVFQHLGLQAAYTAVDATFDEGFRTCAATPCTTPTLAIPAGNRIPGVARSSFYAALSWAPPNGWRAGVEARTLSRVAVNDANTDAAEGHTTTAARVGYALTRGAVDVSAFVRVDNLFDRATIGSVIVNEGNGRFFEPAPGRTWLASVSASVNF